MTAPEPPPVRYWLRFAAIFATGVALLAGLCALTGRGIPL